MAKKNRINLILFITFFFTSFVFYAQNNKEQVPLISVLTSLQKQYSIQFNYAEDVIKDIYLKPPPEENTLPQALTYLEKKTALSFTITDSNFVLVKPNTDIILCGYLKDKDYLLPLASATIQGLNNSTVSDKDGFFKLKIKDLNEQISIRYVGYQTINKGYKQFSTTDCSTIYMQQKVESLSEVLITNYITTGINKINNGSFEIDFNKFEILPGLIDNDVLKSAQAFPGIQSTNETVSNINIRGGTHDQNLILWDDIKMYQSGHFFGLISMFNPQITQKVSLLKNGSDVSYTDGVSGTINMQTSKTINKKNKANIGLNLTDANAFIDLPTGEKGSIQIAGRKSISDFLNTPTYNNYFDRISQDTEAENMTNTNESFDFYDLSFRWLYKISDKDDLRINFIGVSNELTFNENGIVNTIEQSRTSRLTQNSIAGALSYNRKWNDKLQTTFKVYETDYKLKANNVNVLDNQTFKQENVVSETSIKLIGNYKLNDKLHLLGGYHFVETKITNLDDVDIPRFKFLLSEVLRTQSVFSQLNYTSLDKNTNLNLGLRYNYLGKFKTQLLEPRLSFSHHFSDHFTVDVLGEFKHQNTSQVINFQNDFLGIEKRRWQLSNNDDVPVITSKQVSTGISYSNKGWLANIEGYYKRVEGITAQSQGFQNKYEFEKSQGNYQVTGIDLLFRKQIDYVNMWLSYSFMNNDYTFKDLETDKFPSNYDISHAITIGTSYSNKNLKISTGLNWHTGKPTTIPIEENPIINDAINFGQTNADLLKDYIRLDISATYDFKLVNAVNANVGVSIWNVLNTQNEINNFYRINTNVVNETIQRSLGLTPNAVLSVYF